ncbi:MAG: hypothetical protein WCE90_10065 [Candidatus Zixiibacteriota bacterium]
MRDKIKELKSEKKTSSEGPEKLLDIMKILAEGCIRKVNRLNTKLSQSIISATESKNIENTVRSVVLSLNQLHTFLRYIDATRLSRNPTGMIKPWELLIKKYNKNVNIIIRPQWKYNWSYYNIIKEFRNINDIIGDQESKEEIQKMGLYFPILSFAGLERDNVLLHIILAHEIGHFIDESKDVSSIVKHSEEIIKVLNTEPISEKLKRLYDLSVNIMKASIESTLGAQSDLFIQHEAVSQAQNELIYKIKTWLEEITADLIAIRIIGPSFIFALYQTNLAHVSKRGPVGDYPPPQVRIDKCIDYWDIVDAEDRFFEIKETEVSNHKRIKECIKKYLEHIKQKEMEVNDIKPMEAEIIQETPTIDKLKDERYKLLNEIIERAVENPLNSISDFINKEIPAFKIDNNIFELIELLRNRISPVYAKREENLSILTDCDIASILNAGWIFWLTHERELAQEKDNAAEVVSPDKLRTKYYEPLVEISNLVLKGIELTDFNAQFSERKEKQRTPKKN